MTSIPRNTNWGTAAEKIEQLVDTAIGAAVIEANTYTDEAVEALTGIDSTTLAILQGFDAETDLGDASVAGYLGTDTATSAAVATTIANRVGLNILDYPREGGETDDMPRFRRALADLATAGGGRLIVPWVAGGYEFAFVPGSTILSPTRLLITTDNVDIIGLGKPTIHMTGLTTDYLESIDDDASSGRDIFTAFSFAGVSNCSISGFHFQGTYTEEAVFRYQSPRAIAVAFKGAVDCTAHDISGIDIHGNLVNITGSSGTYDAPFRVSENVKLSRITAEHCLENGVNFMGGSLNCAVTGLTATRCANGMEVGATGFTGSDLNLSGNKSSGLACSGGGHVYSNVISTENVRDITGTPDPDYGCGIVITEGHGYQFNGVILNDNYAQAIYLYPGVEDVTFTSPEMRRNATNATFKVVILASGTAGNKVKNFTILGGEIEAEGTVTGGILNHIDNLRIVGMKGRFESASAAFTVVDGCNGSKVYGNDFNKPVTMSDPTGEAYGNGAYKRVDRTSIPTTGTWALGDIINNPQAPPGGIAEWRAVSSGTLGTLNGGSTTGSINSGSTTLTVNSATGLYKSARITIAGVTGTKTIVDVSGTTVTIDTAADATVTDAAVAYAPCVIIPSRQNGVSTSIAAAPPAVGFVAVVGGLAYIATGTSSAADWKQVTN